MRAMILAAGLGTRLRPLTRLEPKPMLPMLGRPMLMHHLTVLEAIGVREVIVNLHYLPHRVREGLARAYAGPIRLHFHEEPTLLGTGGGIKAVADFLREPGEPFLVLNGDALMALDCDRLLRHHRRGGCLATMVLRADARAARFGRIGVDRGHRITRFLDLARGPGPVDAYGLFTGVHVFEPDVLDMIPEGPCCINRSVYPRLVARGMAGAYFQEGYWSDVGTPSRYLEANLALLNGTFSSDAFPHDVLESPPFGDGSVDGGNVERLISPVVIDSGVKLDRGIVLGPSVWIGAGACLGAGVRLEEALVWPGTSVPTGFSARRAVLWQEGERFRVLDALPEDG